MEIIELAGSILEGTIRGIIYALMIIVVLLIAGTIIKIIENIK